MSAFDFDLSMINWQSSGLVVLLPSGGSSQMKSWQSDSRGEFLWWRCNYCGRTNDFEKERLTVCGGCGAPIPPGLLPDEKRYNLE